MRQIGLSVNDPPRAAVRSLAVCLLMLRQKLCRCDAERCVVRERLHASLFIDWSYTYPAIVGATMLRKCVLYSKTTQSGLDIAPCGTRQGNNSAGCKDSSEESAHRALLGKPV
ncbi:MAG: hypothetical protein U0236_20335 [Nitrospira sp.]